MRKLPLEDVRRLLDDLAEWRLFGPLDADQQNRYLRFGEYELRQRVLWARAVSESS